MYQILVADDEEMIRQGVPYLLDYEALGYGFCGEAASGEEAREKILTLQPDVVLMDIRMPGMQGLDVIAAAQQAGFRGKFIIISSFTDFQYAQQAIRLGVEDYLTKPIDEDELERVLLRLKAQTAAPEKSRRELWQTFLQGTGPVLPDLVLDRYQVVLWESENETSLPALLGLEGRTDLAELLPDNTRHILLLKGQAPIHQLEQMLHRPAAGLFLVCSPVLEQAADIPKACAAVISGQQLRFFCREGEQVLYPAQFHDPAAVPLTQALLEHYTGRLLDCLYSFNRRKLAETLQELQHVLCHCSAEVGAIRLFLADLYLQIKDNVHHQYSDCTVPFLSNAEIIHTMEQTPYLYEIIAFLAERFEVLMAATGTSSRDSVLDDVLHYIDHNYAGNITLESIAPLFGYNRSYLGKIFTKKVGMSFNSYVDQVRVNKAKELLLSSDAKVYAIAERVGYKNVDYFHIKFKKYVGISPAEFRKSNK